MLHGRYVSAIDYEIFSMAIILPFVDSRRVVVSYERKYVHEILVNRLVKLDQEESVVRSTGRPDMTITVDCSRTLSTQSTLKAKPHCRFSHVAAQT